MRHLLSILALVVVAPAASSAQTAEIVLLGVDKQPLPFQSGEQILDFLRSAQQISSETLSVGITQAQRLRLARNGVEARAIFHHVDRSEQRVKRLPNGNVVMYLRDSYLSQIAAYELSRLLAMNNVPPTVQRISAGVKGSAQLWIENAVTEQDRQQRGLEPASYTLWNQHYADMRVFDNLINNIDRNQGNMLVDSRWHFWLIDHTRSFGRDKSLPRPETVTRCSRRLWKGMRELSELVVGQRLSSLMAPAEVDALFARRDRLVELLERRIADQGEGAVLFDYGEPEPGIQIQYEDAGPANRDDDGSAL